MRAVHVLAFCAVASIGSAANAQEIDWKNALLARPNVASAPRLVA
jgi:hypothetical protein